MFWSIVAAVLTLSFLLGAVTSIRIRFLVLPPLTLALGYWVVVGWNGDAYDIGRSGLVLITAIVGVIFVFVCCVGFVVGRLARLGFERSPKSSPVDS